MKILVCVKQVPDTSGKVAVNPDGTLNRASMQTIINPDDMNAVEAALKLKDELGCKVTVVTMGPPPAEGMLRELMAMGADDGYLVSAREFGGSDTYATSQILAAALDTIGLDDDDIVFCGRQAIDGDTAQVCPKIAEKLHLPQITYAADLQTEVVEVVKAAKKLVDLVGADYIVSVGRGISKDVEGGIKLAHELADVLGGVVGGSRVAIDSGWLTADHQVGQTGKTVHPKVYVALGISGAIQHKAGMSESECIIAVNKNETAPIFEIADYGICGDLFKVTPMLIEAFKAAKASK